MRFDLATPESEKNGGLFLFTSLGNALMIKTFHRVYLVLGAYTIEYENSMIKTVGVS